MPSRTSADGSPAAAGATTRTLMPSSRSATARRRMNDPAASPSPCGKECVKKRTFIFSGVVLFSFAGQILDAGSQQTQLGALCCNQLTKQSGGKENAAHNHARF